MAKQLEFGSNAREKILEGASILAKAVGATLGPKGRNAVIEKGFGDPRITKDGVTVAREIVLKDRFQNLGAQMIKAVASKTNDLAGDGTTTATVLAESIFREGVKAVAAGMNPMDLKRGIDRAVEVVTAEIHKVARKVIGKDEIAQIGTISANGDKEVGNKLAEAMDKVGKEGVITIEEGQSTEFELEIVDGMQFDRGYISPYFMTNGQKMTADLEGVYILLFDGKITGIKEILPLLELVVQSAKALLIVAEDVDGEALATLIRNKMIGALRVVAIRSPGFGDRRKDYLGDIATITGASIISTSVGIKLENANLSHLGYARRVAVAKDFTTIIDGSGKKKVIEDRCKQIRTQIKLSRMKYETEKLQERLAKIIGGVAIVKVGGTTEVEVKERRDRVEDALHATKAAVEEGIVPGGGSTLFYASRVLSKLKLQNQDQQAGVAIIERTLTVPLRKIAENAGIDGAIVVGKLLDSKDNSYIYDAQSLTFVDAYKSGIIDPAKVVRCALQDASSIAGLLITTEVLITEEPIETKTEK